MHVVTGRDQRHQARDLEPIGVPPVSEVTLRDAVKPFAAGGGQPCSHW